MRGAEVPPRRLEPLEKCGNWVWLSRIEDWTLAVDAFGGFGVMACALASHFLQVHCLDTADGGGVDEAPAVRRRPGNVSLARASLANLPYADGSVSCIVTRLELLNGPAAALAECRRVLRPGGCLSLGFDNPFWSQRIAQRLRGCAGEPARIRPSGVIRALIEAGFADVQRYCVEPSLANPWSMFPATGHVPARHEAVKHFGPMQTAVRATVARSPLRSLLCPAYICLAYA